MLRLGAVYRENTSRIDGSICLWLPFTQTKFKEQIREIDIYKVKKICLYVYMRLAVLDSNNQFQTFSRLIYLRCSLTLSFYIVVGLPSGVFPLRFLNKMYQYIFLSRVCGTCSIFPIPLGMAPLYLFVLFD
jgi:hypothetical protein